MRYTQGKGILFETHVIKSRHMLEGNSYKHSGPSRVCEHFFQVLQACFKHLHGKYCFQKNL